MERSSTQVSERSPGSLHLTMRLEGRPTGDISVAVYAFDRKGRLLASAPIEDGAACIELSKEEARRATILVGPIVDERTGSPLSKAELEHMHAYRPKLTYDCATGAYELAPVPELYWRLLRLLAASTMW